MILAEILRDTEYSLTQFSAKVIKDFENKIFYKETKGKQIPHVKCAVRNKDIVVKPEEAKRQLYIEVLHTELKYPLERMQLEFPVWFGREVKRAD